MKDFITLLFFVGIVWLVWRAFTEKPAQPKHTPPKEGHAWRPLGESDQYPAKSDQLPPKEDAQTRHLKSALQFSQAQHKTLMKQQREQDAWQQSYGHSKASELDHLSGKEFEEFLAGLYRAQGYAAELTTVTGDYGADLILSKDNQRICVQAKRYAGSVGVAAVQEALSGKAYYQCNVAWVITTGTFTTNALELAAKSGVKMIGRSDIGNLMAQHTAQIENTNRQRL
jgi:restriction system protein